MGKPRTLEILYRLQIRSPLRFKQIQKRLGFTAKDLDREAAGLVKLGLTACKSYNEIPPRVDYELTQKRKDLGKKFSALRVWADKYGYAEQPRGRRKVIE